MFIRDWLLFICYFEGKGFCLRFCSPTIYSFYNKEIYDTDIEILISGSQGLDFIPDTLQLSGIKKRHI